MCMRCGRMPATTPSAPPACLPAPNSGCRRRTSGSRKGEMPMKTSQDRILTTHVGSLPRPPELRQLLVRKDQGKSYDKAELDRLTRQAVVDIVRRQAQTGV